jgi:hypothetical protein
MPSNHWRNEVSLRQRNRASSFEQTVSKVKENAKKNRNDDQSVGARARGCVHGQAQAPTREGGWGLAADYLEHGQGNRRRDQVECADFLLWRENEADESEGIPAISRGIQFVQTGLHPIGISEWRESERCVRVTGRRLCGWKKTGDVLRLEGREIQGEGFACRYHQMAEIVGEIV